MAGRIPQHFIDQLLNRIDIVDLIDGYVPLKKAGANYKACCPFHNEKTPSFTVSASKQFYHCFGCGQNGTAISFLMDYDHMEFREAIEKLAASAGMDVPEESSGITRKPIASQGIDLYNLLHQVSDFYQQQLRTHADKQEAIDYLKQRGLSGEVAKRFGLGFAPEGWDNLLRELGSTTSAQKALLDTGMLTKNDKERVYDRFRYRIMFPIIDHRGRMVGFGGRVLGSGEPKYLNSPETPIFHKGSELYGLFSARGAIKKADSVLVVEGYMDVVALAQAGIDNAVATLGTATTPMHMQRLFRHTPNIIFSFDGDRAGKAAAWKALNTSLPLMQDGHQVSFLFLPDGEDPDTMVKKVGTSAFLKLIEDATPLPDFLITTLQQQADIDRLDGRAKLVKLAKPLLNAFPEGVLKKLITERISRLTQLAPTDLTSNQPTALGKPESRNHRSQPQPAQSGVRMTNIRRAISLILQYPQFASEFQALLTIDSDKVRGIELIHQIYAECSSTPNISTAMLLERYRNKNYFETLKSLANHPINNLENMSNEAALLEIQTVIKNIGTEAETAFTDEAAKANLEWEALTEKAKIAPLTEEETTRKALLAQKIRDFYRR